MGSKAYRFIQYGKETPATHGTHVAATKILLGTLPLPRDIEPTRIEENIGVRAKASRNAIYQKRIQGWPLTIDESYYQALPMLFSMCVKGAVTAALGKTGQSDYTWDFTPGLTKATEPDPDSFTIEIGDDKRSFEVGYVMASSLKFSGQIGANQAVKISADLFGDYVEPDITKTAGLTLPTVVPIMANNTRFYADTAWSGKGVSNLDGIIRSWELEIIGGAVQDFGGNAIYPTEHHMTYVDWKLALQLEDNDDADDFYDWYRAQTAMALRIKVPGPQIGTGDTYNLQFDLWGAPSAAEPMGAENEGQHMLPITFDSLYDTTGAATLGISVTTNSNAA
jgi:hypothetical protein